MYVAEQVFGCVLLVGLLVYVIYLLSKPVAAAWALFRDSRGGRPWLLHGARVGMLAACSALLLPLFVLLLLIFVDFVFTGGQVTLGVIFSLF